MEAVGDKERLEQLITARHPCIHLVTREEDHARKLINGIVAGTPDGYWLWCAVHGVRAGLLDKADPVKETENPAAAIASIQIGGE